MLLICPQTLLPICTSNNNSRPFPHNTRAALHTTKSLPKEPDLGDKDLPLNAAKAVPAFAHDGIVATWTALWNKTC